MSENSKNSNSSGIIILITIIILVVIGLLWWILGTLITLIIIFITSIIISVILIIKYLKSKNNSSKPYVNKYKSNDYKQQYNHRLGIVGENIVKQLLKNIEKEKNLELLNNLYLSSFQNKVKQIDRLLISDGSLFVIETKNWSFPTYGDIFQKNWIQYQNDKKVFVPSPIQQNVSHVKTICDILKQRGINLNNFNIYNVVVFVQNNLKMKEYNEILNDTNVKALNLSELSSYIIDRLKTNYEYAYSTENTKNVITKIILECNKHENIELHREQLNY